MTVAVKVGTTRENVAVERDGKKVGKLHKRFHSLCNICTYLCSHVRCKEQVIVGRAPTRPFVMPPALPCCGIANGFQHSEHMP